MRSLPFTTGAKPISLSGFNRCVGIGSYRKNLIFAPCAAAMGVYACTFGSFCAILQKAARLSHTVLLLQLIPARGRKLYIGFFRFRLVKLQLIPARGRKLSSRRFCIRFTGLQLIPARGRKHVAVETLVCFHALQLIPARGRKLAIISRFVKLLVATYPREGTETGGR